MEAYTPIYNTAIFYKVSRVSDIVVRYKPTNSKTCFV